MSLFNMLMGRNPYSPVLLACLGIHDDTKEKYPLGRIRDVYTNEAGDRVFIFTRNGEYEDYAHVDEALAQHPNYVQKTIDDFDSTYATYEFTVPDDPVDVGGAILGESLINAKELVATIANLSDTTPPMQRFRKLMADMESGEDNEQVRNALEVGKQIMKPLTDMMDGKDVPSSVDVPGKHGEPGVQIFTVKPETEENES